MIDQFPMAAVVVNAPLYGGIDRLPSAQCTSTRAGHSPARHHPRQRGQPVSPARLLLNATSSRPAHLLAGRLQLNSEAALRSGGSLTGIDRGGPEPVLPLVY
jgi:hypothetical protein